MNTNELAHMLILHKKIPMRVDEAEEILRHFGAHSRSHRGKIDFLNLETGRWERMVDNGNIAAFDFTRILYRKAIERKPKEWIMYCVGRDLYPSKISIPMHDYNRAEKIKIVEDLQAYIPADDM
jgi:hypothetical protein